MKMRKILMFLSLSLILPFYGCLPPTIKDIINDLPPTKNDDCGTCTIIVPGCGGQAATDDAVIELTDEDGNVTVAESFFDPNDEKTITITCGKRYMIEKRFFVTCQAGPSGPITADAYCCRLFISPTECEEVLPACLDWSYFVDYCIMYPFQP